MKKNPAVLLSFCLLLFSFTARGQKGEINIDNAYYLAKTLCNPDDYSGNDSKARKVLGGLLWYMNGEEQRDLSQVSRLADSPYVKLKPYVKKLTEQLQKEDDIFRMTTAFFENCFSEKFRNAPPELASCSNTFLIKRNEYDSLLQVNKELGMKISTNKKNRNFIDTSIARKQTELKIAQKENDAENIRNLKEDITEFTATLKMLKHEFDSLDGQMYNNRIRHRQLRDSIKALPCMEEIRLSCLMDVQAVLRFSPGAAQPQELKEYNETVLKREYIFQTTDLSPLSFKLPSQTEIIDALAIYLAKRVKQESVMWFFETLQRNAKIYDLVKTFFPETLALLNSKEVFEIPNLGAAWRYALSKDFVYMPRNVFKSEWLKSKLGKHGEEITDALHLSWEIARLVEQKYNYNDIIASIYLQNDLPRHGEKLRIADMISLLYAINNEFIKENMGSGTWLKFEELLYMTDEEFQVMLSLVDARYHHVFSKLVNLPEGKFSFTTQKLNRLRRWTGLVLLKVNQIDKLRIEYKEFKDKSSKEGLAKFEYSDYNTWKFLQDLIKTLHISKTDQDFGDVFKPTDGLLGKILDALVQVQEVYSLLQQKNFAGAVDVILNVADSLTGSDFIILSKNFAAASEQLEKTLRRDKLETYAAEESGSAAFYTIPDTTLEHFIVKRNDKKAIKIIRNLAGFLNDVAQAENSKALSRVVESYALPPGSYKKKRNSWKSADLAAYVGVFGGYERVETKIKGKNNSGAVYGITAPVGLSLSKTFGKRTTGAYKNINLENPDLIKISGDKLWKRSQTTLTAFFSIIDIGAVVSYRFNNQDTVLPQKIKWAQVVSPGVHFNISIKGTPLVFSTGVQYTPQLRNFKQDSEQRNAVRFYGGILFDLPLFNLWTKSEIVRGRKFL
jgi:hypothetical protein